MTTPQQMMFMPDAGGGMARPDFMQLLPYMLMGAGQSLSAAGGPSPYKQGGAQMFGAALGGASQGMGQGAQAFQQAQLQPYKLAALQAETMKNQVDAADKVASYNYAAPLTGAPQLQMPMIGLGRGMAA